MNTCSVEGCDKGCHGNGYCKKHYQRMASHGDVTVSLAPQDRNADVRFDARVELIPETSCHWWTGGVAGESDGNGYGALEIDGKKVRAHRYAYERANGPIPDGLLVRHLCHNRLCVNPDHLEVGTQLQNIQDMLRSDRKVAKLNAESVREIRASELSRSVLAAMHGVSEDTIYRVVSRQSWKHVEEAA